MVDPNFCNWKGITCTPGDKNVHSITIGSCNLVGKIPSTSSVASIFGLKFLVSVFISPGPNLFLEGALPDDFHTEKPVLTQILLTRHHFSGRLPESLLRSTSLVKIDLHSNNFQGGLPADFRSLESLEYFSGAGNKLAGSIPKFATQLTTLGLANNVFTGSIPADIATAMPKLVVLFLRSNLLEGEIPALPSSVAVCDLDHNTFSNVSSAFCHVTSSMPALQNSGGCDNDYPDQPFRTCCVSDNSFSDSQIQIQCPALHNCFPGATQTSYDCAFPAMQCKVRSDSAGQYPDQASCAKACISPKPPTPPPSPTHPTSYPKTSKTYPCTKAHTKAPNTKLMYRHLC